MKSVMQSKSGGIFALVNERERSQIAHFFHIDKIWNNDFQKYNKLFGQPMHLYLNDPFEIMDGKY